MRRIYIITGSAVLCLVVILFFQVKSNRSSVDHEDTLAPFSVAGWVNPPAFDGYMEIKRSNDGSSLLLKRTDQSILYSYNIAGKSLGTATIVDWNKSFFPISKCDGRAGVSSSAQVSSDYKLKINGREFDTNGLMTASARLSPDKAWAAAILVKPSVGGALRGRHYQQLIDMETGQPVGNPRLFINDYANYSIAPCWSADQDFIVYQDVSLNTMLVWVLDTNLPK